MFSLVGKSILITGASSGIGRQIAIAVSEFGGNIICVGRDKQRLEDTLRLLSGDGHSIHVCDVKNFAEIKDFVDGCPAFDGVVFNAGVIDYAPVKFINHEKLSSIFDVNFNSVVQLNQQLIKNKRLNKSGSLVFISSISSVLGVPGTALYASSKAALNAYSKVVASELSVHKIRANSVLPGIVVTAMTQQAIDVTIADDLDKAAKEYPLGYGKPQDIAGLVIYLLSDASRWMTGSEIVIDGGLTLK